jgi:hypothetical protein
MAILRGLPDTKRDKAFDHVHTVSGVLRAFRRKKAAVAAGDFGSITIWIDDNKCYRCEAQQFYAIHNSTQSKTLKEVVAWAKKWLPWCQTGELHHD